MKFVRIGNTEKKGQQSFVNLDAVPYIDTNQRDFGRKYILLRGGQDGLHRVIAKVFEDETGYNEILDILGANNSG